MLKPRFKVINFRSMLILCVALGTAVFLAVTAAAYRVIGFSLCAVFFCGLTAAFVLSLRRRAVVPLTQALAAVLSAVVFTVSYLTLVGWHVDLAYETVHRVEGTVESVRMGDDMSIVLTDLSIDGAAQKGNVKVYVDGHAGTTLEVARPGDIVGFAAKLYAADLADGLRVNASLFRNDVRFTAYAEASDMTHALGEQGFREKLRTDLYRSLTDELGKAYGDVAYGMLTGDTYALSDDVRDAFSVSGIGHVLSVSGLHIGFLSGAILLLLRRARPAVKVAVTGAVLVVYVLFIGFSPTVVRSVIMCAVGLVALLNGRRKDGLSALCLAMSVILLFWPLSLYDVGFQMSAGAVFAMLAVGPYFKRGLRRARCPERLASSLSVSFSAQLGVTPCLLYYFRSLSVYSVLTNLVLMPLMTAAFVVLFATAVLAMVIPPAAAAIRLSGVFLWIIDAVARGVTHLPFASVILYAAPAVFLCYPLFFVMGDYFMIPKGKGWVALGAAALCLTVSLIPDGRFVWQNCIVPVNAPGVNSIVSDGDGAYFVGDFGDGDAVASYMKRLRLKKLDAIWLTTLSETSAADIAAFLRTYPAQTVYIPADDRPGLRALIASGANIVLAVPETAADGFTPLYDDGVLYGYSYDFGAGRALFLGGETRTAYLPDGYAQGYGIVRSKVHGGTGDRVYLTDFLSFGNTAPQTLEFVRAETGDFAFRYRTGDIVEIG